MLGTILLRHTGNTNNDTDTRNSNSAGVRAAEDDRGACDQTLMLNNTCN